MTGDLTAKAPNFAAPRANDKAAREGKGNVKIPATFCTGLDFWDNWEGLHVDCDPRRTETGGDRRCHPVSISTAGSFSLRSATVRRMGAVQERPREALLVVTPSKARPRWLGRNLLRAAIAGLTRRLERTTE